MINALIVSALKNRFVTITAFGVVTVVGVIAMMRMPVDAIPDLSENQSHHHDRVDGADAKECGGSDHLSTHGEHAGTCGGSHDPRHLHARSLDGDGHLRG